MTNSDTTTTTTDTTVRPEHNAVVLSAALDWCMDCVWADVDADDIAAMPNDVIVRAIQRHYVGGWAGFLADSGL